MKWSLSPGGLEQSTIEEVRGGLKLGYGYCVPKNVIEKGGLKLGYGYWLA